MEHWPNDVRRVFAAIGDAMAGRRLMPEMLSLIPNTHSSLIPGHSVTVSHVTGKALGKKRGHYIITITGQRVDGRWRFKSGQLERLARLSVLSGVSPDSKTTPLSTLLDEKRPL